MADNSTSSTNQRDIDEIWASLLRGDEPPRQEPTARAVERDSAVLPATPTAATDPAALYMSENPFDGSEEDYQEDWLATLPRHPTLTNRRRAGKLTIIEALSEIRSRITATGGVSWFQLISAVQMVGGDEYKVRRIADKLADAGVIIIERPIRQMSGHNALWSDGEEAGYEEIARVAFAQLSRRTPTWDDVALALGNLRRKVTPDLRPRLLEYYNLHQLNRTNERALFAQLEALRAAYPDLDPRGHEVDDATRLRWRRLPPVAAIYDIICTDQLWSVARNALRYQSEQMPFDDLLQEGCIGVLRAIDTFAPMLNVRFTIYANNWATQRMRRAADESSNVICLPAHMMERYYAGRKAFAQLKREIGCLPLGREVDEAAGLKRGTWRRLQGLVNVRPLEHCRAVLSISTEDPSTEEQVNELLLRSAIDDALTGLSERDRQIIELRFGLNDGHERTLEEIARQFEITRERIRQIELKTLRKLRHSKDGGSKLKAFLEGDDGSASEPGDRWWTCEQIVNLVHVALMTPKQEPEGSWGSSILERLFTSLVQLYRDTYGTPDIRSRRFLNYLRTCARTVQDDALANAALQTVCEMVNLWQRRENYKAQTKGEGEDEQATSRDVVEQPDSRKVNSESTPGLANNTQHNSTATSANDQAKGGGTTSRAEQQKRKRGRPPKTRGEDLASEAHQETGGQKWEQSRIPYPSMGEAATQSYRKDDESASLATVEAELLAGGISIEPKLVQMIEKYAPNLRDRHVLYYRLDPNDPASDGRIAIALNISPSKISSIVNQFVRSIRMQIAVYSGRRDMEQEAEQLSYWLGVITERINAIAQVSNDA